VHRFFVSVAAGIALAATALPVAAFNTTLSAGGREFVNKAVTLNDASLRRAHDAESAGQALVLDYAEEVTGDRQAMNTALTSIAQAANYHGYPPVLSYSPSGTPTERPNMAPFNPTQYFRDEIASTQTAISLYSAEASSGSDAALRSYAKNYLPKLKGELSRAKSYLPQISGKHR
jgi:predicted outer membrane protein